jgi:hypothetical protein
MSNEKIEIPKMVDSPDLTKLKLHINNSFEAIGREDGSLNGEDFRHYVFEHTMEALYGKDVWKWFNKLPTF